jgi:hypothetical protein
VSWEFTCELGIEVEKTGRKFAVRSRLFKSAVDGSGLVAFSLVTNVFLVQTI